jgi:nicotinamidase-related amidase
MMPLNQFRSLVCSCSVFISCVSFAAAQDSSLKLNVRSRLETEQSSKRWHATTKPVEWKAAETAIVICDMWDRHWCSQATERVGQMAPRMNEVVNAARDRGALIIHCPSDTLDFYKNTRQRKLAQSAPKVETKVPLQNWCHLDASVEGMALPIDDSDGGCDCETPVKNYRAWSRQHPAIEIADGDAITDSAEAFYLMKQRGISNVVVMGVHTNMCVLGRPFSIRQMVQQGQNVVLMRDMTDTMYNPKMAPFVSHFTGTDLIVEHIEKYWCPTILSSDFIGGDQFRFQQDKRKHLVVLCAEREYLTHESLPKFAAEHLGHDFRVSFVWDDVDDRNNLPGIDVVADADILLISVRRRTLPKQQAKFVREFVASGKPVIGIRTASHAFCLRGKEPAEGLDNWPEFDSQVFGGNYTNHHGEGPQVALTLAKNDAAKDFLQHVAVDKLTGNGSLYKVSPLADSTTPLLTGSIPGAAAEPIAWLNTRADGGTSMYTSLGHVDDFEQPQFLTFLKHVLVSLAK